jgi:hypothetical protein
MLQRPYRDYKEAYKEGRCTQEAKMVAWDWINFHIPSVKNM